jgi:hypothetical protein
MHGGRSYSRDNVESISILHYSSLILIQPTADSLVSAGRPALKPSPNGEIVVTFQDEEDGSASGTNMQALVLCKLLALRQDTLASRCQLISGTQ